MEKSEFVLETSHEEFRTMQGNWREEIQQKFIELKQVEEVIKKASLFVYMHNCGGGCDTVS